METRTQYVERLSAQMVEWDNQIDKLKDKNEEVEKYGIEYAMSQAEDLIRNDVSGLHIYSMNRSEPVKRILQELSYPR